jgi:acetyl esterase/lipase
MSTNRADGGDGSRRLPVLDPVTERMVAALTAPPHLHQLGPADGRTALREVQGEELEGPGVRVEFQTADTGPRGLVGYWTFRPSALSGPLPVVLYVHGGRWMFGDAATHARLVRELTLGVAAVLVVPEYTRTPDARYPVAVEEIYALLLWVVERAAGLGMVGERVAVAGDCVGATMATALTMMAKHRGGPRIRAQLLYYPFVEPRCDSGSHEEFASLPVLSRAAARWYWQQYCHEPVELNEPTVSPLRARTADLVGLPPTLIVSAEVDVVRDEPVTAVRYLGTVHDLVSLRPLRDVPTTRAGVRQGAGFLADALTTARI